MSNPFSPCSFLLRLLANTCCQIKFSNLKCPQMQIMPPGKQQSNLKCPTGTAKRTLDTHFRV